MASEELSIVGIEASSRDDAHDVSDTIDELVDQGRITVREVAIARKTKHGRTKIDHVTDHGAGIGAAVGAGWGAVGLGSAAVAGTLAASAATAGVLPLLVGAGIGMGASTGLGAAVGKAFNMHHEAGNKVLKSLSEHVENGHAAVFVVADPANAEAVAEAFTDREVHTATISGEDQEAIASTVKAEAA